MIFRISIWWESEQIGRFSIKWIPVINSVGILANFEGIGANKFLVIFWSKFLRNSEQIVGDLEQTIFELEQFFRANSLFSGSISKQFLSIQR